MANTAAMPTPSDAQAPRLFEKVNASANGMLSAPADARIAGCLASATIPKASKSPSTAAIPSAFGYWKTPASLKPTDEPAS